MAENFDFDDSTVGEDKAKNDEKLPTPWWGWLFIVVCVAIPVIAVGGAIPSAIGAGAAAGCYSVSKNPEMSATTRMGACLGITVIAWALFGGLIFAVASMT
ncbi:MAG: hypothetical protein AAFR81_18735 [Chloroflexota bacterium]